jgi:transport and Golgi organization protein 2
MCTVTFIPVNNKIFITSNRDEKRWRKQAVAPTGYKMQTGDIFFPKDTDAGGSWFAVHENGNAVIFLNGGWMKHISKPPYNKSRGLILLDLIDSHNPYQKFLSSNFINIEPFTAIIFCMQKLYECRWDGKEKTYHHLQENVPHIWSSVTLYDDDVIAKRKKWFEEWLKKNPEPLQEDILWFHQFTGDGDKHNDLMIDRDGITFTVSITSLESDTDAARLKYLDFKNQQTHQQQFEFSKAILHK